MIVARHRQSPASVLLHVLGVVFGLSIVAGAHPPREDDSAGECGMVHAATAAFNGSRLGATNAEPQFREAVDETDVLHYNLDLEVSNLNTGGNNCIVTGTNAMLIRSKSDSLTQFTFRLHSNYTVTSATVTSGPNTASVTVAQLSTTTRQVTLDRAYGLDEEFTLTIAYTGTSISIDDSIDVATQGGNPVVFTLSEPFGEYTWWPSKDGDVGLPGDNSDKATMEFSITAPNNFVVPSNGVLQGVDTLSGNRKRYRWATNYAITPYLVSFAATNYNTWTKFYNYPAGLDYPAGSMPVQFYIYPGSDTVGNRALWEKSIDMIAAFRQVYGEYPFLQEKYGIYNFNYGGGMEHQTMTGQGGFSESLTSHELSHQWWGDMITCKTWNEIWLNEGFATFSEAIWLERRNGGIDTAAYLSAMAARRPSGNGSAGSVYRYNTSSLNSIFSNTFSYNKGAWVLHMLRHVVGDATFFDILAAYRAAYAYQSATTADFAAIASDIAGRDLTPFFNQWVYQRGAPNYRLGWQSVNVLGQEYLLARIEQTQTATTGSAPQVLDTYIMPVDLRATIGGMPVTQVVQNDARSQWFALPVSGPVTALSLDPSDYILHPATVSTAYAPGPPKIVATDPAPGSETLQSTPVSQVRITLHTPANVTLGSISLYGAATGLHAFTLVSDTNANPLTLQFDVPLPPDQYTLTISSGVSAADSGMALDGEVADTLSSASFPSGNGVPGGVAVIQFSVVPCALSADIDANCAVDATDVDLFVQVLLGQDTNFLHVSRSDLDDNGDANGGDIPAFIHAYVGS